MKVSELYDRGYALGTGAKLRNEQDGDTYVLGCVAEYKWVAINVRTGDRHRDVCDFNCSFQANRESVVGLLGVLSDWSVVQNKIIDSDALSS
jgi:hypothetical protein